MLLGFPVFLGLLVLELPVIKQATHRRDAIRGDLNEVNVSFARDLECLRGLKNAELLAVLIDDSNLAHTDSVIHAEIFANLRAPLTMPCWQYRNAPGQCQDCVDPGASY